MFQVNKTYERQELLKFIGSNQPQSGILWNKLGSDIIIVTTGGRNSKSVSYSNFKQPNGNWVYTGQGEKGDQDINSFANSLLKDVDKKILLFTTREPNAFEVRERGNYQKLYTFEGLYKTISWSIEIQTEGKRKGDKLIKYIFQPIHPETQINLPFNDPLKNISLEPELFYKLRERLIVKKRFPEHKLAVQTNYERSYEIKQYALLRAKGKCENCDNAAPFLNVQGIPFLEVHHIYSLSDSGPDTPTNVAAICPNCHKEAHYGENKEDLKHRLSKAILVKEENISKGLIKIS